jgi:hypothetical protein
MQNTLDIQIDVPPSGQFPVQSLINQKIPLIKEYHFEQEPQNGD